MEPAKVLAYSLVLAIAAVGTWDVYLFFSHGTSATVSATLYRASLTFPPLLLAIGFVLGHLFWPQTPEEAHRQQAAAVRNEVLEKAMENVLSDKKNRDRDLPANQ
jgi:hypothetical protein